MEILLPKAKNHPETNNYKLITKAAGRPTKKQLVVRSGKDAEEKGFAVKDNLRHNFCSLKNDHTNLCDHFLNFNYIVHLSNFQLVLFYQR